jgi:hypothetical protein
MQGFNCSQTLVDIIWGIPNSYGQHVMTQLILNWLLVCCITHTHSISQPHIGNVVANSCRTHRQWLVAASFPVTPRRADTSSPINKKSVSGDASNSGTRSDRKVRSIFPFHKTQLFSCLLRIFFWASSVIQFFSL